MNEQITVETAQLTELIRSLVNSYIDHAQALELTVRDFGDQASFVMRGHTDDHPRLVGAKGSHVAALEFLVQQMGRARQVVHKFRLLEPESGARREAYPNKVADAYDTGPMAELLENLVLACGIDEVRVATNFLNDRTSDRPLSFSFSLFVRTADDHDALIVSPVNARHGLNIITAINTLFRAAGAKAGVKFSVFAVDPSKT